MPNFVEALGRSRAITDAITGIQGIQQNELAIQNTKMQTAINEQAYKKIQAEEAAGKQLMPLDPMLNRLTPTVKDYWLQTIKPYIRQGTSGGNYIERKDMPEMMKVMETDT